MKTATSTLQVDSSSRIENFDLTYTDGQRFGTLQKYTSSDPDLGSAFGLLFPTPFVFLDEDDIRALGRRLLTIVGEKTES